MREEHVDGGYLVTLGTYVGPEDFSKQIVRQLQIERRLAPFWKGLDDHSDSWTEAQLVAAARGLPVPAADEVPPDIARIISHASSNPDVTVDSLMVPITGRSQSYQADGSASLSTSQPLSPTNTSQTSQLLRGRAKTLASLATGIKSSSSDLTPQEVRLSNDPLVNGQPLEACLYKDAAECPICFLYYPPYLNRTRCCDQSICSECFVQIKRPDPHPPEHEQPGEPRRPEEEADMLISEPAACPFCVTPEFGVTYDPPPFRRGLAYANSNALASPTSAMSSSSSLQAPVIRRRATSLSANAPQVVTTDKVRPDWAKKLADARAHALRRSAAATALHNAAYMLGNPADGQGRGGFAIGRRRRTLFGESPGASGSGTPREGETVKMRHVLVARADGWVVADAGADAGDARSASRRARVEDLEDLMMMEAIRLSLAAEEERKRKEEKEAAKEAKKKAKAEKKEEKKLEKLARKGGSSTSLYHAGPNESASSWAGTSMGRSTSNLGAQPSIPEEHKQDKGKRPIQDFAGFNPLTEPTSTLNRPASPHHQASSSTGDAQRHLEVQRAHLGANPLPSSTPTRPVHLREVSNVSSADSSFLESAPDSNLTSHNGSRVDITTSSSSGAPATGESMFNFGSLAAIIDQDDKSGEKSQHIEYSASRDAGVGESRGNSAEPSGDPSDAQEVAAVEHDLVPPPRTTTATATTTDPIAVHDPDTKNFESVNVFEHAPNHHLHPTEIPHSR
jgi:hypothetical protein